MDWDKIRIFHVAAEAGSFTHAGDQLDISQSAVSRQVSALEEQLNVSLFHRHARGLILTEQGELLYRTAHDVFNKLKTAETMLADATEKPFGDLKVTTTLSLGAAWLTPRLNEFIDLYPDIKLHLLLSDDLLDISMREADVAIWLREPTQQDLIRRKLFRVSFHVFATTQYIRRFGKPRNLDELENHRILTFDSATPPQIRDLNWLETAGLEPNQKRDSVMTVNNLFSMRQAVKRGIGIAVLPDYLAQDDSELLPVLQNADVPSFDTYFVYPEELRNSKRLQVFREFLISRAKTWHF